MTDLLLPFLSPFPAKQADRPSVSRIHAVDSKTPKRSPSSRPPEHDSSGRSDSRASSRQTPSKDVMDSDLSEQNTPLLKNAEDGIGPVNLMTAFANSDKKRSGPSIKKWNSPEHQPTGDAKSGLWSAAYSVDVEARKLQSRRSHASTAEFRLWGAQSIRREKDGFFSRRSQTPSKTIRSFTPSSLTLVGSVLSSSFTPVAGGSKDPAASHKAERDISKPLAKQRHLLLRRSVHAWVEKTAEQCWFLAKHAQIRVRCLRRLSQASLRAWRHAVNLVADTPQCVKNALVRLSSKTVHTVFTSWRDLIAWQTSRADAMEEAWWFAMGSQALAAWAARAALQRGVLRAALHCAREAAERVLGEWGRVAGLRRAARRVRGGVELAVSGQVLLAWSELLTLLKGCRGLSARVHRSEMRVMLRGWRETSAHAAALKARWPCTPPCLLGL